MIVTTVMSGRSGIIPFIRKSQDQRPNVHGLRQCQDQTLLNPRTMPPGQQSHVALPISTKEIIAYPDIIKQWGYGTANGQDFL